MESTSFQHLFTTDAQLSEIGRRVARLRLQHGWSQQVVADRAGVSLSSISRLESGQSTTLQNFLQVLDALGLRGNLDSLLPPQRVSPLELLDGKARPQRKRAPRGEPGGEPGRGPGVAVDGAKPRSWAWGDES